MVQRIAASIRKPLSNYEIIASLTPNLSAGSDKTDRGDPRILSSTGSACYWWTGVSLSLVLVRYEETETHSKNLRLTAIGHL